MAATMVIDLLIPKLAFRGLSDEDDDAEIKLDEPADVEDEDDADEDEADPDGTDDDAGDGTGEM